MAIDKFKIPLTNVPIFFFNSSKSGGNYNYYSLELSYNGIYSGRTYVQYTTSSSLSPSNPDYYRVYDFNAFIQMINTTLSTAFTNLGGLITLPVGSVAPFLAIDENHVMSLYAQKGKYDTNNISITPIKIYMNNTLWNFTVGISADVIGSLIAGATNGRDVVFNVWDKKINTVSLSSVDYLKMASEYGAQTVIRWNICNGVLFTSSTIPVAPENLPNSGSDKNLNSRSIVANFDLIYTPEEPKPLTAQYVLQSPYKKINLINNIPLNNIDIAVYWYDNNNNTYPLTLYLNESVPMRFVFISKKSGY
jgi:hypothetical protein